MTEQSDLLDAAVAAAHRYISSTEHRASPTPEAIERLTNFASVDIDEPIGVDAAIEMLDRFGSPATMRSTGGRYFGFVNGGVTPEALAASTLVGAWDQNVALPAMSPAASAIDAAAATMIVDALGLPHTATAAFCAGATIANITAIVTARDALLERNGWDIHELGLVGAPAITVVISAEAHVSVHKALRVAGFGQQQVIVVPSDPWGRLDVDQLPAVVGPTLVLLQAGNVNTGHSDQFDVIIDHFADADSWVHVDGAFGLWANAVPNRQPFVAGVERADSWATDGHKWLNAPYDCGVVICADGAALRHSMRMDAAYVPTGEDERSLMNLGLQMSQAARAVPVWTILAARGRDEIADSIERCCACAERFADRLTAAGATVLTPVAINQVLVVFDDDATTDRVVDSVQDDGICWMGATTWQGQRAMRISVSSFVTTFDDVDASVESILRAWQG